MRFHGLRGRDPQLQMLLTSRPVSQIVWPSREVGRSLLPAPSPQPSPGFRTHTSLISDLLYLHGVFRVLGIEPSCSALFCPTGPCVGLILGTQGRCL